MFEKGKISRTYVLVQAHLQQTVSPLHRVKLSWQQRRKQKTGLKARVNTTKAGHCHSGIFLVFLFIHGDPEGPRTIGKRRFQDPA